MTLPAADRLLQRAARTVFKALSLVTALALPQALPANARANSTRMTPTGRPFRWTSPAITLRVDPSSLSSMNGDAMSGLRSAALAWSLVPGATRITVEPGGTGQPGHTQGLASTNELIFYQRNFPLTTQSLAVTLVSASVDTGEIYDADVLVQATRYRFEQLGPLGLAPQMSSPFDFQSMVTHEFGHVLGLGEDYATPEATMFPTAMPGAVSQRSLTMTDIDSLSVAYTDAGAISAQGCASRVAPSAPRGWMCLVALAGAAVLSSRRRTHSASRWAVTVGAALVVVWAAPSPVAQHANEATVIRARSFRAQGLIYTTALIDEGGARREVTVLGGALHGVRQAVLDGPSGDALTPGATVTLDGANVRSVRAPIAAHALNR